MMPIFDEFNIDKIINGTDDKIIRNRYDELQTNYTKESAKEFMETYKDKPISFLINNSRYIFSEPYYGYNYYSETVLNPGYCHFLYFEKERDKIQNFVDKFGKKMPSNQKVMYETLLEKFDELIQNTKSTTVIAETVNEMDNGIMEKVSDSIFSFNVDTFMELFNDKDMEYNIVIEAFLPYIAKLENKEFLYDISNKFVSEFTENVNILESEDVFKTFCGRVVSGNKAKLDYCYQEGLSSIQRDIRTVIVESGNVNLQDVVNKIHCVNESYVPHVSGRSAINSLFDDIKLDNIFKEAYDEEKQKFEIYDKTITDVTMAFLENDYGDSFDVRGYTLLDGIIDTYEDAITFVGESDSFFVEAEEPDKDDTEDSLQNKKGVEKPEKPDLLTRIQNKAMDTEVKQIRLFGKIKKSATAVRNAAKAVLQLPINIINSIKDIAKKMDEADDDRRKKYITEPGFRKKIYRNAKLSLMYYGAVSTSLALLPITLVARFASKEKNKRIRNECIAELTTELKICEEKIRDATDNNAKYKLMRIKGKLEQELIRVKTNTKYI